MCVYAYICVCVEERLKRDRRESLCVCVCVCMELIIFKERSNRLGNHIYALNMNLLQKNQRERERVCVYVRLRQRGRERERERTCKPKLLFALLLPLRLLRLMFASPCCAREGLLPVASSSSSALICARRAAAPRPSSPQARAVRIFLAHLFDVLITGLCHFDNVHSAWHFVFCHSVALFSANRSLQFFLNKEDAMTRKLEVTRKRL